MTHSLDYMQWCLERLTPHEYVTYLAICEMGTEIITQIDVAKRTHQFRRIVGQHLKKLKSLGFVLYALTGTGTEILWIRRTKTESVPDELVLKRKAIIRVVRSPEGKSKWVEKGKINEFCRKNNLEVSRFRKLLAGKANHHHGWTLVE